MLLRDEAAHARGMLKRAMLVFAFLVPLSVAYHFWKVSEVLAEQVELLREQCTLQGERAKQEQTIAFLMSEGTRLCAAELVQVPKWLGIVGRKPVAVALRGGKMRGGVGGPER